MSDEAADAVLTLLADRVPGATICPSEAARVLAAARGKDHWRDYMDEVHGAVDALSAVARVRLSWRGEPMARREGPYRIA